MHAIAHGGCTDTVRKSALEADSGKKIPCCTRDSNPRQYCAWLLSRTFYQLSYSRPQALGYCERTDMSSIPLRLPDFPSKLWLMDTVQW